MIFTQKSFGRDNFSFLFNVLVKFLQSFLLLLLGFRDFFSTEKHIHLLASNPSLLHFLCTKWFNSSAQHAFINAALINSRTHTHVRSDFKFTSYSSQIRDTNVCIISVYLISLEWLFLTLIACTTYCWLFHLLAQETDYTRCPNLLWCFLNLNYFIVFSGSTFYL